MSRETLISLIEVSQVRIHNDHVPLASFSSRFVVCLRRHLQVPREAPLPVLETITRGRPSDMDISRGTVSDLHTLRRSALIFIIISVGSPGTNTSSYKPSSCQSQPEGLVHSLKVHSTSILAYQFPPKSFSPQAMKRSTTTPKADNTKATILCHSDAPALSFINCCQNDHAQLFVLLQEGRSRNPIRLDSPLTNPNIQVDACTFLDYLPPHCDH